ncbi:hypothetical protein VULLAG_LOCUS6116 [Vulpes lagopus]
MAGRAVRAQATRTLSRGSRLGPASAEPRSPAAPQPRSPAPAEVGGPARAGAEPPSQPNPESGSRRGAVPGAAARPWPRSPPAESGPPAARPHARRPEAAARAGGGPQPAAAAVPRRLAEPAFDSYPLRPQFSRGFLRGQRGDPVGRAWSAPGPRQPTAPLRTLGGRLPASEARAASAVSMVTAAPASPPQREDAACGARRLAPGLLAGPGPLRRKGPAGGLRGSGRQ